jgi:type II secretory pathway pseudopilin PulG
MELAGQPFDCAHGRPFDCAHGRPFDVAHGRSNRGYAMAALLVGMSVMAVLMSALMPVWTHMATREKEEELIFRGKQYARAIGLFQRKFANTPPPTIDVLVEQRFLRKKYKDPITNDDFQPIYASQGLAQTPGTSPVAQRPGQQPSATLSTPGQQQQTQQSGFGGVGTAQGGVVGVTSKSKDASIKLYNGRNHYNEWAFVYIQTAQRPGQSAGPGIPGGQGQPGQRPGSMQPGGMPGGMPRPGGQPMPPGFGQPNRPPVGQPFPTPNITPQGQRRPGGQ